METWQLVDLLVVDVILFLLLFSGFGWRRS